MYRKDWSASRLEAHQEAMADGTHSDRPSYRH
jgi:hypothetical protein